MCRRQHVGQLESLLGEPRVEVLQYVTASTSDRWNPYWENHWYIHYCRYMSFSVNTARHGLVSYTRTPTACLRSSPSAFP